jgi:hypothetical protein
MHFMKRFAFPTAGAVSDQADYSGDFMVAVAEIACVPLPAGRDSVSFLPAAPQLAPPLPRKEPAAL